LGAGEQEKKRKRIDSSWATGEDWGGKKKKYKGKDQSRGWDSKKKGNVIH